MHYDDIVITLGHVTQLLIERRLNFRDGLNLSIINLSVSDSYVFGHHAKILDLVSFLQVFLRSLVGGRLHSSRLVKPRVCFFIKNHLVCHFELLLYFIGALVQLSEHSSEDNSSA